MVQSTPHHANLWVGVCFGWIHYRYHPIFGVCTGVLWTGKIRTSDDLLLSCCVVQLPRVQALCCTCNEYSYFLRSTPVALFCHLFPKQAQAHGAMGLIVMILGLLQPLNAFFRPHNQPGEEKSKHRQYWEYVHKGSGYFAIVLAVPTIFLGTLE